MQERRFKHELHNYQRTLFFSKPLNTVWTFVDSRNDTTKWQYTRVRNINGTQCSELTITTPNVLNIEYYTQENSKIYQHAAILPNGFIDFNNPNSFDTLFILDPPSLEYVYNQNIGYSWMTDNIIATFTGYNISTEELRVTDTENITTPAGTYNCTVIESDFGMKLYVSEFGLIKQSVLSNDSSLFYENVLVSID